MGKVKQRIQLSASQVDAARRMGIPLQDLAKAVAEIDGRISMTTFNPNKNPVYSIPLSELVNLWRARYGDTWVDVSEIEEEFWEEASSRLHQNNLMEELNHHSDTTPWSRLKEGA